MIPDRIGQAIQVITILDRALLSVGDPVKRFQPIMAPTIAWDVDTG